MVGMQNIRERVTHSRQELAQSTYAVPQRCCPTRGDNRLTVNTSSRHWFRRMTATLMSITFACETSRSGVKAREQVTSGRHTMRGVNYDAVEENQEQPEWTVFYNGREDVLRNAHASHDEYREAFDMGPHVDPFHWQQPEPLIPITEFVAGARSASGGAHNTEKARAARAYGGT